MPSLSWGNHLTLEDEDTATHRNVRKHSANKRVSHPTMLESKATPM
jgi:hypothetical protein